MSGSSRPNTTRRSTAGHGRAPPAARPSAVGTSNPRGYLSAARSAQPASPTPSVASVSTSRMRATSPSLKRKERDFDMEDSETNITVVVRCRSRNAREIAECSGVVLSTPGGLRGKEIVLGMGPSALNNKTYTFDRVFPPEADQAMVYDDVVHPILTEVGVAQRFAPPSLCSPRLTDVVRIQLHHLRIRPNGNRKDIHHVG